MYMYGVLDLAVSAQDLNPDSQTLKLSMVAQPYGLITYTKNNDLVMLSIPSTVPGFTAYTIPVSSCHQATLDAGCADMIISYGSQGTSHSTGDYMGRMPVNVDAATEHGLDYYPFDTYTATGTVRVSKHVSLTAMNSQSSHA
jgi:hypothetical protein